MARKKANDQLIPLELDIMDVLETGQATVQMVTNGLPEHHDLA